MLTLVVCSMALAHDGSIIIRERGFSNSDLASFEIGAAILVAFYFFIKELDK